MREHNECCLSFQRGGVYWNRESRAGGSVDIPKSSTEILCPAEPRARSLLNF